VDFKNLKKTLEFCKKLLTFLRVPARLGLSTIYREIKMTTIKDLRIEAGLSALELAGKASISLSSINRMENLKSPVRRLVVSKTLKALSQELGRNLNLSDIEILLAD
jgi:Helix-turn-helix